MYNFKIKYLKYILYILTFYTIFFILKRLINIYSIFLFILKNNINKTIDLLSYSFILGGSLGNGIDRIFKGYVVDFINLNFINFPIFNLADIAINIGFFLILYSLLKSRK